MFATHQARLVKKLALFGITDMASANRYLREQYLPAFNAEFMQPAMEQSPSCVLLEMAVLASDLALSPITPEILAARELRHGTLQLLEDIAPDRQTGCHQSITESCTASRRCLG